ncbi:unnamed protein product [Larinioides sclopetarius]|uniref:Uncharacterized protein n=1 Tax=Larinioides sclopetarius TaxID=280406 RepID=A0AAV1YU93_9ARAC
MTHTKKESSKEKKSKSSSPCREEDSSATLCMDVFDFYIYILVQSEDFIHLKTLRN